jgi:hypothetical protein
MNCETGFLRAPLGSSTDRQTGTDQKPTLCLYTVGSLDPDHDAVMRIGGDLTFCVVLLTMFSY